MPKALCIFAMVVAILVLLLFLADLVLKFAGMEKLAPFYGAYWPIDVVFAVSAGVIGFLAWKTYREQV